MALPGNAGLMRLCTCAVCLPRSNCLPGRRCFAVMILWAIAWWVAQKLEFEFSIA